jgi:hypothetical protein
MKTFGIAGLILAALSAPVWAEVAVDETGPIEVTITREDCLRLVRHAPAPGVAYQGGVDVNGNTVAPAELGGGVEIDLPETIRIPIEVDILSDRRLGEDSEDEADGAGKPLIGEARVGTVEVDVATGRATFNGQPLTTPAQRRLAETCQRILRQGE